MGAKDDLRVSFIRFLDAQLALERIDSDVEDAVTSALASGKEEDLRRAYALMDKEQEAIQVVEEALLVAKEALKLAKEMKAPDAA